MAEVTYLRGRVMRVTKLDGCGNVVLGPDSKVVSDGFISIALTPNVLAGEAIQLDNAWGERVIDDVPVPRFVNFTEEFSFIGVNPSLLTLMTGMPVVKDAAGTAIVGFDIDSEIDVSLLGFAVEFWTGVGGDVCVGGASQEWGYGLLPFNKGGTIGAVTVANAAINFTVTGAQSKKGNHWGVGPYTVVEGVGGVPGPLNVALPTTRHLRMLTTSVTPPTATDGSPSAVGVPATGAVAATGASTPTNSYFPDTLANLISGASGPHGVAVTASPNTAWTTGQKITLRDGTTAHWSGTAWVAGPA
jgi:hypothetical protein